VDPSSQGSNFSLVSCGFILPSSDST
jgi:hypothetical protein